VSNARLVDVQLLERQLVRVWLFIGPGVHAISSLEFKSYISEMFAWLCLLEVGLTKPMKHIKTSQLKSSVIEVIREFMPECDPEVEE